MIGDNIVEPLSLVTAAYAVGSALCGRAASSSKLADKQRGFPAAGIFLCISGNLCQRRNLNREFIHDVCTAEVQREAVQPRRIASGGSPLI